MSLLVIMPKKGGKWLVCVYYKKLNVSTKKDHFPLPLNTLLTKDVEFEWTIGYDRAFPDLKAALTHVLVLKGSSYIHADASDYAIGTILGQKVRVMQLKSLDEIRREALHHTEVVQNQRMGWHDEEKKF